MRCSKEETPAFFYGQPSRLRFKAAAASAVPCNCCCCSTDLERTRLWSPKSGVHHLSYATRSIRLHLVNRRRMIRSPLIRSHSLWNIQPCYLAVRERLCPISFHLSAVSAATHSALFLQVNGLPELPGAPPRAVCLGLVSDEITGPHWVTKSSGPKNRASSRPILISLSA